MTTPTRVPVAVTTAPDDRLIQLAGLVLLNPQEALVRAQSLLATDLRDEDLVKCVANFNPERLHRMGHVCRPEIIALVDML